MKITPITRVHMDLRTSCGFPSAVPSFSPNLRKDITLVHQSTWWNGFSQHSHFGSERVKYNFGSHSSKRLTFLDMHWVFFTK